MPKYNQKLKSKNNKCKMKEKIIAIIFSVILIGLPLIIIDLESEFYKKQ